MRVSAGERVTIEVVDALGGQIRKEGDSLDALDWNRVNPATGPIFVEGAEPGNALKVTIEKNRLGEPRSDRVLTR
jgi:amidase